MATGSYSHEDAIRGLLCMDFRTAPKIITISNASNALSVGLSAGMHQVAMNGCTAWVCVGSGALAASTANGFPMFASTKAWLYVGPDEAPANVAAITDSGNGTLYIAKGPA